MVFSVVVLPGTEPAGLAGRLAAWPGVVAAAGGSVVRFADGTLERKAVPAAAASGIRIEFIPIVRAWGAAHFVNRALVQADEDAVLLVDDAVIPDAAWIERLCAVLAADETLFAASAVGVTENSGELRAPVFAFAGAGELLTRREVVHARGTAASAECLAAEFRCCLVRLKHLRSLGGLDAALGEPYASADLGLRARCQGWRSVVAGDAVARIAGDSSPQVTPVGPALPDRFRQRWQRFATIWALDEAERNARAAAGEATRPTPAAAEAGRENRIRVLVDLGRLWPRGANGGVRILIAELLATVRRNASDRVQLVWVLPIVAADEARDFCGDGDEVWILPDANSSVLPPAGPHVLREAGPQLARRLMADVVYAPLGVSDFSAPDLPLVSVVVDVVHRDFPATLPDYAIADREAQFSTLLATSYRLQCNSNWVAQRMQHHYGVPAGRMFCVYNAVQRRLPTVAPAPAEVSRVFLYPANAWAHKNHETLLLAYVRYRNEAGSGAWDLVLTGYRDEAMDQLAQRAQTLGVGDRVHVRGLLPETEYARLWARTGALVFPSLHEGFGIPILEAMHLGVPVIAGRVTAIPEVAGDACLWVNPLDAGDLARAMQRVQSDQPLRDQLIAAGHRRAASFSLDHEAAKLVSVLTTAAQVFRTGGVAWRATEPIAADERNADGDTETSDVLHCIDEPRHWDEPTPLLVIRGWCFSRRSAAVVTIEGRSADGHWRGVHGLPRPDVAAAHDHAPGSAESGFVLRLPRPRGTLSQITCVAVLTDGTRVRLRRITLPGVSSHPDASAERR